MSLLQRFTLVDKLLAWLGVTPTTPLTIVVGLALSILYVVWALTADSIGHPLTELTINTIGLFCSSLVFAGVTQFGIKRSTDDKVVAAKHGNLPQARDVRATTTMPKIEG